MEEEGCSEFEVYVHRNNPNSYELCEVYEDDASLGHYQFCKRLLTFRDGTDHMIATRDINRIGGQDDIHNSPGGDK